MWKFRRVKGKTMTPAFIPGAMVVVAKKPLKEGDVVLAEHEADEALKRIVAIDGNDITLENDQKPEAKLTVSRSAVVGKVIYSLPGAAMAPRSHRPAARVVASICAAILIGMVTAQLITFDKFIELLDSYWLPGLDGALLGAVIVSLEVLALPYLLHMALSTAARVVSIVSGWLVALLWLAAGVFLQTTTHALESSGHLGTVLATPPGLWMIVFGAALLVLVVVSDWMLGGV